MAEVAVLVAEVIVFVVAAVMFIFVIVLAAAFEADLVAAVVENVIVIVC